MARNYRFTGYPIDHTVAVTTWREAAAILVYGGIIRLLVLVIDGFGRF